MITLHGDVVGLLVPWTSDTLQNGLLARRNRPAWLVIHSTSTMIMTVKVDAIQLLIRTEMTQKKNEHE